MLSYADNLLFIISYVISWKNYRIGLPVRPLCYGGYLHDIDIKRAAIMPQVSNFGRVISLCPSQVLSLQLDG